MKNILLFLSFLLMAVNAYAWKPIFAGHRGCYTGVENTEEAYRNGVSKYGYQGLECDVRVTKDKQYVIMHDETTNRLGGSLTVAEATLSELQAEDLSQTRGGVYYKGKICTVSTYLDVCNENNVFPLMELKWTTGINNNDMSNFPGLYELVKSKGLIDKVVFLTSMKNSIEYIRKNYPSVKCKFLCNSNWSSNFDWCKSLMVNPSIQSGCFDLQTVKKFHDIGLQVAVWTVDSEANYEKYGNMGVYMVTSNSLDATKMKELDDIDWDAIPEVLDPLTLFVTPLYRYSAENNNLPDNFPVGTSEIYKTAQQGTYVEGVFYTNDYGTSTLLAYDANGKQISTNLKGTNSHGITSDDAGNLILRNDGITENPNSLILYKKGETEPVQIGFELLNPGQTNFISASGDVFSKEGGHVYFFPNGQSIMNYLIIAEGKLVSVKASNSLSIAGSTAGIIIPIGDDPENFLYLVRNQGFYNYCGIDKGGLLTSAASTRAPGRNSSVGGAYFSLAGHNILVHLSGANYNGGFSIKDMSANAENLYTQAPLGSVGYAGNPSCGSFFKVESVDDNTVNLYEYSMGSGYAAYKISTEQSSIDNISNDNKASAFLYPTCAECTISITSSYQINDIKIVDVSGRVIRHLHNVSDNECIIDVASLSQGLYLVVINNHDTLKFFKQ